MDYWEIAPYPTGRYTNGQFIGRRRVECPSGDIKAVLAYLDTYPGCMWPSQYDFGVKASQAICVDAFAYPKPGSKVTSSSKPFINMEMGRIDMTYSTAFGTYVGGRWIHEEFDGGLRPLGFGRTSGLTWVSDGGPVLDGYGIDARLPIGTYSLTQYRLAVSPPNVPSLWGCANNGPFQTLTIDYNFATDTLLYAGAHVERNSPGSLASDYKWARHTFYFHPAGWSKVFRADINAFDSLLDVNGNPFKPQTPANLYGVLV